MLADALTPLLAIAALISIVTHYPRPTEYYKRLVADEADPAHVTVEVIHCESEPCIPIVEAEDRPPSRS